MSPLPSSLLAERAKAAAEPAWLTEARRVALDSYANVEAPRLARTDLHGVDVESLATRASSGALPARTPARAKGVVHMPLVEATREHPDLVRGLLTTPVSGPDKWARLHHALWNEGALVFVERNADVEAPIQLDDRHPATGALVRNVVVLAPGSRARIVQRVAGLSKGALSIETLDLDVQANASLQVSTLQDVDHGALLFSTRRAAIGRDARLQWVDGQFGGGKVVAHNETNLDAQGGALAFVGAFFGSDDQHFDITTSALHRGPHTSSQLTMKGALSHDGYAVNYSIVNIGPDAKNASGHQHQETLLLSDKARADAIPKLDVENNEVSASHGATVGQVDAEQVFYLRSRGLNENQARRVIVEGFFEPLLREIPVDDAREEIRAAILSRLKG